MRRLGIVAVELVAAVALVFGAGAFALYVWPGREEAPSVAPPRYTSEEAIGIVRGALDHEGTCSTGPLPQHSQYALHWNTTFHPGRGLWTVTAFCGEGEGAIWGGGGLWYLRDESGEVIPVSDLALDFMRPRHE
jgi:hypothetical protein